MAVNKVDIYISQLLEDLNNGFTWLEKDNLGYGSIETKYGANEKQIMAIRKHPSLKDAETNITIFNIIDDTKLKNQVVDVFEKTVEQSIEKPILNVEPAPALKNNEPSYDMSTNNVATESDSFAAFADI